MDGIGDASRKGILEVREFYRSEVAAGRAPLIVPPRLAARLKALELWCDTAFAVQREIPTKRGGTEPW